MWIFTKDGFFSIVKHKDDSDYLLVRARVREDIVDAFGPDDILELTGSDYRFRKTVPRAVVADYLSKEAMTIDYTSVKDDIDKGEPDRHHMLYETWRAHWDLQQSRYGRVEQEEDFYDLIWKNTP
jgi:hypothetical protein